MLLTPTVLACGPQMSGLTWALVLAVHFWPITLGIIAFSVWALSAII